MNPDSRRRGARSDGPSTGALRSGVEGIMAVVVEDGSGAEVDGAIGGEDEEGRGSNIEPEISDTKLIGSGSLCLVKRRL